MTPLSRILGVEFRGAPVPATRREGPVVIWMTAAAASRQSSMDIPQWRDGSPKITLRIPIEKWNAFSAEEQGQIMELLKP